MAGESRLQIEPNFANSGKNPLLFTDPHNNMEPVSKFGRYGNVVSDELGLEKAVKLDKYQCFRRYYFFLKDFF
jgi:hypothetical protein